MLIAHTRLTGCPVLSLHVGGRIATTVSLIIDPHSLQIIAFKVEGPMVGREMGEILPTDSIRELSPLGMIVDSFDEFVGSDDIVRIKDILALNFELIGLKVVTERGTKLGHVVGFSINPANWQVEQLIVQRPFLKALLDPELVINRTQIVEVDDYKITVRDAVAKAPQPTEETTFTPNFINPFRDPNLAREDSKADQ